MNKWGRAILWMALGMLLPFVAPAQDDGGLADEIKSLHEVLTQLYDEMMPLCSQLIGVGRGIAGFAALWYIASRVWRHLANAESIDFYPLLRPFCIGFCILIFPMVISMINGIMQPTVTGTSGMVENSDAAVALLLKEKEEAIKKTDIYDMYVGMDGAGNYDKWYKYTHPEDPTGEDEGWLDAIGNGVRFEMAKIGYNFRNSIKEWMSEILQVLFAAAALCINTIRTFNLLILAILGPLVFGLSVFDGFQHSLRHWLARYINVFLWLPIANIFGAVIGKIQENMLKLDLSQIEQAGDTFFSRTDAGYLIFMLIGIVGYFTVPSIANYVMYVGGGDALSYKTTAMVGAAGGMAASAGMGAARMGGAVLGGAADTSASLLFGQNNSVEAGLRNLGGTPGNIAEGYNSGSTGKGFAAGAGRAFGRAGNYLRNKLGGGDSS